MRDTIDMAEEAGAISYWHLSKLKAFEALVRADERDRAMRENAYVQAEREACAKVVEDLEGCAQYFPHVPDIIRNRGNT
jgi:hypothetical protein